MTLNYDGKMKDKQKAFQLMVKMISSEDIYLLIVMK